MKVSIRSVLVTVACSFALASSVAKAELPQVSNPRLIQPPPGANVAAAYFTLTNAGSDALSVSGVESNVAKMTELHLSKVENDVAKMIKQDEIVVQAGESLEFRHGSFHVMFMGLKSTLESGDTLDIVLKTSAGDLPVTIPVITLDENKALMQDMNHEVSKEATHDMKMDHGKSDN